MDFGKILTRSWEIIWKYKALWIFGILASFGSNFNFGGNFNYSFGSNDTRNLPPEFARFFANWERSFNQFFDERRVWFIAGLVCVALLIGLLFWVVGVFGKVGLIKGVLNAEAGRPVGFRAVAGESWSLLGRALGLSFLLILLPIAFILLLVVASAAFGVATLGIGLICLIPFFCLLLPLFLLYFLYTELAIIALIKENLGLGEALTRGWEVFRSNLGNLIGMGLILFVGSLLVGILISLPVVAIMAPAFFGLPAQDPNALGSGLLVTGILFLIALPFLILINGVIRSYIQSAWTLTYMHLTASKPRAKARA
ncbi:MAG: hypothetical protein M1347_06915 [Chloroflexi bacterium]|nr:hypothetical protein [Chloroflexota bacterium]